MRYIALDTETTGLEVWNPLVRTTHVSWFTDKGKGGVYKVDSNNSKTLLKLKRIAASSKVTKLFWNAKFDIPMLAKIGIKVKSPIVDVMIVAQMVKSDEPRFNLKHFARKFLKEPYVEEKKIRAWSRKTGKPFGLAPDHIVNPYTILDSKTTLELWFYLKTGLDKYKQWDKLEEEIRTLNVVRRMENRGVPISEDKVDLLYTIVSRQIKKYKKKLTRLTGNPTFNPNSPKQVSEAVYDGSIMPTRRSAKTGNPKVDEIALLLHPSKIGSTVVKYRKAHKSKQTYLKNFKNTDTEGRIHPSFNQAQAKTGRFSCSGPNLQNIPRPDESILGQLRGCIEAKKGWILLFNDFDQVEVLITAHFTQEEWMLEAIHKGKDIHNQTALVVFNKRPSHPDFKKWRYISKKLNYATEYGVGAEKFRMEVLKDTQGDIRITLYESHKYINDYKSKSPKLMELFSKVEKEIIATGGVRTHYDRFIVGDKSRLYAGVNYLVQGTAADLLKIKMREIDKFLRNYRSGMIMTIHDELVYEIHHKEMKLIPQLIKLQQELDEFTVPITVSAKIGKSWLKTEKYNA